MKEKQTTTLLENNFKWTGVPVVKDATCFDLFEIFSIIYNTTNNLLNPQDFTYGEQIAAYKLANELYKEFNIANNQKKGDKNND